MSKLWLREQGKAGGVPPGLSPEKDAIYYFQRAINFAPDDSVVRMLYAIHLASIGRIDDARRQYEDALTLSPDSPEIHYNAGLFYFELNSFDRALRHAHIAYGLGYPLNGLRRKLKSAGRWEDMPQLAPAQDH